MIPTSETWSTPHRWMWEQLVQTSEIENEQRWTTTLPKEWGRCCSTSKVSQSTKHLSGDFRCCQQGMWLWIGLEVAQAMACAWLAHELFQALCHSSNRSEVQTCSRILMYIYRCTWPQKAFWYNMYNMFLQYISILLGCCGGCVSFRKMKHFVHLQTCLGMGMQCIQLVGH